MVVTVNVALVAPFATVTLEGTVAADVLLLDSDTTAPPAGAGPVSVTVPVDGFPPTRLGGFKERDDSEDRFTERIADLVTPPYKPEIVTAVEPDTGLVVTANVALVAPTATVTLAGTAATNVLSLDSDTTTPPAGAGPLSVTVPVEPLPPTTVEGLTEREDSENGFKVRFENFVTPP